jgi:hypothetical protein
MRVTKKGHLLATHRWSGSVAESVIIVEGPDGSGKTTLAEQIASELDREYRRPPPEALDSTTGPASWLADWWEGQLALHPRALAHGVYDRTFYISDPIYQQAQPDRKLLVDGVHLARGISRLWSIEPVLIFCLPPIDVQLANVHAGGRERLAGVSDEQLVKINNAYWSTYAWCAQALYDNVMLYDYTEEGAWERLRSRFPISA